MASSSRTTDILVGQIHLADVVGIARENRGDEGDLEDEAGRSEVGVGGLEGGGLPASASGLPARLLAAAHRCALFALLARDE
jgi:hypothetical protein